MVKGELIREKRKLLGLSAEELAVILRVTEGKIYKWEKGHKPSDPQEYLRLMEWMGKELENVPPATEPTQNSNISNHTEEYISLLKAENLRLKNDLQVNLSELKEKLLLVRAICITNQFFLAEVVAKQRKQDFDQVRTEISKANSDTVERLKKADRFVVDNLGSGA